MKGLALFVAVGSVQAAAQTVTFRDGVAPAATYAGTRDVSLFDGSGVYWSPGANYGNTAQLRLRGGTLRNGVLVRWDVSILSPTTPVYGATAYFTAFDSSSASYEVYEASAREVRNNRSARGSPWPRPSPEATREVVTGPRVCGAGERGLHLYQRHQLRPVLRASMYDHRDAVADQGAHREAHAHDADEVDGGERVATDIDDVEPRCERDGQPERLGDDELLAGQRNAQSSGQNGSFRSVSNTVYGSLMGITQRDAATLATPQREHSRPISV